MKWKKINEYVSMLEKPALGTINQHDGKRYMALCIDPLSKKPYRGIARQVTKRIGNVNVPGYADISNLVIVESKNMLKWEIKEELNINRISEIIAGLLKGQENEKELIGLEDPDIIIDENGTKHVYFTIAFRYKNREGYDAHLGHAKGKIMEELTAEETVLDGLNEKIRGFKELCFLPDQKEEKKYALAETEISEKDGETFPGMGLIKSDFSGRKWKFIEIAHNPKEEKRKWCEGESSPCRIFNPKIMSHKGYLVGIMNGREPEEISNGARHYGKFRPGLFLFDKKKRKIVWVADEPLFEDPDAETITFASELIQLSKKEAILYAHPNDSFVRAYKLDLEKIKKMLPSKVTL